MPLVPDSHRSQLPFEILRQRLGQVITTLLPRWIHPFEQKLM